MINSIGSDRVECSSCGQSEIDMEAVKDNSYEGLLGKKTRLSTAIRSLHSKVIACMIQRYMYRLAPRLAAAVEGGCVVF